MSAEIQIWIVAILLFGALAYVIYKIVNLVRGRKESASSCCGCDIPCKARDLKVQKAKKNRYEVLQNRKIEPIFAPQSLKRSMVPWPSG